MYMVLEFQKQDDKTLAGLITTYETKSKAEEKYHTILSFAAVSEIPKHGAIIIDENGMIVKEDIYTHGTGEFTAI